MYFVYILYSKTVDKYYVGYTNNLEHRLEQHNSSHKGFTSQSNDWEIAYSEEYESKQDAMQREKVIKSWKSRKRIEMLLKN